MERVLTSTQVAKILHLHSNTVRRWSNQGRLPNFRLGARGDRRFPYDEIRELMRIKIKYNGGLATMPETRKAARVEICFYGVDYKFRCPDCDSLNINGETTATKCPDCGAEFAVPEVDLCECRYNQKLMNHK